MDKEVHCVIEESWQVTMPPVLITLALSLVKQKAMADTIRKCTELGVDCFIPMITKHTVIKENIVSRQSHSAILWKEDRYLAIAMEASKQCERASLPVIEKTQHFGDVLSRISSYDLAIILAERSASSNNLKNIIEEHKIAKTILLFLGPEGGFSADEINMAIKANIKLANLGNTILRSSTVAIVSVGILLYEFSDKG